MGCSPADRANVKGISWTLVLDIFSERVAMRPIGVLGYIPCAGFNLSVCRPLRTLNER